MSDTWDIATDGSMSGGATYAGRRVRGAMVGAHDWNFTWTSQFQVPAGVIKKLRLRFNATPVWLVLPFRITYRYGGWDDEGYRHVSDVWVGYGSDPRVPIGVRFGGHFAGASGWDTDRECFVYHLNYWWWATGFGSDYNGAGDIQLYPNGAVNATGPAASLLGPQVPALGTPMLDVLPRVDVQAQAAEREAGLAAQREAEDALTFQVDREDIAKKNRAVLDAARVDDQLWYAVYSVPGEEEQVLLLTTDAPADIDARRDELGMPNNVARRALVEGGPIQVRDGRLAVSYVERRAIQFIQSTLAAMTRSTIVMELDRG